MPTTRTDAAARALEAARGAAWIAKQVEISLQSADLSAPQYRVLSMLGSGSASASDAAERLAVSRPSVTAVIDGLVARRLVTRGAVEGDRRRVELVVTAEGLDALLQADRAVGDRLLGIATHGDPSRSADDAIDALRWWLEAIRASRSAREAVGS